MPTFNQLREWAHDGVAVLGVLAVSTALIVTVLALFGVHVSEADVAQKLGGVGALVTLISKAVDSWNNAKVTSAGAVSPVAPAIGNTSTTISTAPPWPPPGVTPVQPVP